MVDWTPFVSVIIPVLNGERTIRECLVSLLRMEYPPERREILVVDNGSTDRTAEIVRSLPVRCLREKRRGASLARNMGIGASGGEILAFTDADCVVSTRWARELVRGFEDGGVGGVEGEVVDYPPVTPAQQFVVSRRSFSYQARLASPFWPFVLTANVAFRRQVFERIGLFDPRFPAAGGEDIDFSWRFFQGAEMGLRRNPKAIVFHQHRTTAGGFFRQQIRNGRGIAILRTKYPARLPWTWRQELQAWGAAAGFAGAAARAAIGNGVRHGTKGDVNDLYFTFLRKLGVRIGFLWGTLPGRKT
jgi:glycosyltransferase involved in cell wall biosynthesis